MTNNNTDEPSNMLPQVADDQMIPALNIQDPAASLTNQVPLAAPPIGGFPTAATQQLPQAQLPQAQQPTGMQMPDTASDTDLIEKEWVEKAKQIVDHTADDPFKQQEELSNMKADYLKKRYNKDLGAA